MWNWETLAARQVRPSSWRYGSENMVLKNNGYCSYLIKRILNLISFLCKLKYYKTDVHKMTYVTGDLDRYRIGLRASGNMKRR